MGWWVHQDLLDNPVNQVLLVPKVVMVSQVPLVLKDGKGAKEILDNQVSQVPLEKMEYMDSLDHQDQKEKKENWDCKELLELEVSQDLKDQKETLVLQDSLETQANKGLEV